MSPTKLYVFSKGLPSAAVPWLFVDGSRVCKGGRDDFGFASAFLIVLLEARPSWKLIAQMAS
jgi:hypothetical protein